MITFEDWDNLEDITREFAPAQYKKLLQNSVADLTQDAAMELAIMAIRADAELDMLPEFLFEAGPLMRHPVTVPPEGYMAL